jgi:tetratricopeptide (TPR) repeat protein
MNKIYLLLVLISMSSLAQFKPADFDNAMKLMDGSDQQKALSNLEALEKKYPKEAQVIFLRGFYQFRDGDQNSALMNLSNAIKINPRFALAYGARAQLFSAKGMLDKSISDITIAIDIEPKNVEFYYTRARYYSKNQQNQEAINDYKTIIKLSPTHITPYYEAATLSNLMNANGDVFFIQAYAAEGMRKFVVDFMYAKFLMNAKRFDEAKPFIEASLVDEKEFDGDDLQLPAIIFYKTKNYQKAIEYYHKAIAKKPSDINFRCNLASVYIDLKDWQKVKETAQGALDLDPNYPLSNMYMAIGLKWTGNERLGLEYEAKAKRLDAEQNKN